jgi:hypothetical protein
METTPEKSVEEIAGEYRQIPSVAVDLSCGNTNEIQVQEVTDWLTQTLQTERQKRDEMVESVLTRIETSIRTGADPHIAIQLERAALTQPTNPK